MTFTYSITPIASDGIKIRSDHAAAASQVSSLPYGKYAFGNGIWEADEDGANVKAGDTWLEVLDVGGQSFIGWIAVIHNGETYGKLTRIAEDPAPEDPDLLTGERQAIVTISLAGYEPLIVTTVLKPKP